MENAKKEIRNEAYDTNACMRDMIVTNPLRECTLRSAIEALGLREGSRGLDAG